jgi:hypothetical protein
MTILLAVGGTAPAVSQGNNSLKVDTTGKVGIGSSAPQQKLHVADTATPTVRLEQTGGTPRTWDVGASNTSFFVKDVTGNSAIPLRIAAGAATSSIDIGANGKVGIGVDPATFGPATLLTVKGLAAGDALIKVQNTAAGGYSGLEFRNGSGTAGFFFGVDNNNNSTRLNSFSGFPFIFLTDSVERMRIEPAALGGDVGIGTSVPASKLHVSGGDIRVTGGSFIDDGVTLNAPDYVFDANYPLMPLRELALYVAHEKHLPNIPSAGAVKSSGLNLGQFQMQLLEKVEELTLHLIAQQREIDRLGALVAGLRAEGELHEEPAPER